tara:strand:+ start:920 stop:1192 length:273 start_codon:yes stop_codon:yes gene_type:complete
MANKKPIFKEPVEETAAKIKKEHERTRKMREAFANKAHEARMQREAAAKNNPPKLSSTEAPHLTSELTPEEKAEARAKTTKKANKIWDEF